MIEDIELTEEEAGVLDGLQDPDEAVVNDKYQWDEDFQREIISFLLRDKYFLIQSEGLIKWQYFTNEVHQRLCRIVFDHFNKYSALPSQIQLQQELRDSVSGRDQEIQIYNLSELSSILNSYIPNVETREYYRDRVTNFAKSAELKTSFHSCLKLLQGGKDDEKTWDTIQMKLRDALSVDRNFDSGLDYFQTVEERYERMKRGEEEGEYFTSGFHSIDAALMGNGLKKGELGSVCGPSGSGKSLFLTTTAVENLHRGKKVLYISLEIDPDEVAKRFDAQLANITGSDDGPGINTLLDHEETVITALKSYVGEYEDPRMLIVKQFPGGQMGMSELRAYYQQLALRGFQPDLVIVDYIGEMKDYPNMKTYESRYRITRDLRGFAVENNIGVLTAMQPNRSAKEAVRNFDVIDDEYLSDSFDQIKPLDAFWTINQVQAEKDENIARMFVSKHRHGKDKFIFWVEYNPNTLKISEISKNSYEKRYKTVMASKDVKAANQVDQDMKKGYNKKQESDKIDDLINNSQGGLAKLQGGFSNIQNEPSEG